MRGFRHALFLAVVALAVLLVACAPDADPAPPVDPAEPPDPAAEPEVAIDPDARIRFGAATLHPYMEAHHTGAPVGSGAHNALFDRLVAAAPGGELEPRLVESWSVVSPTEWELTLRPEVLFHNGEPFNAETVKWNLERIADPDNQLAMLSNVEGLVEVQVVDDLTVRLITGEPIPIYLYNIRVVRILPNQYFESVGREGFNAEPVGTGPFRFVSGTLGDTFVGERYDDYWAGPAQFGTLEITNLPEAASRVAGLRGGAVDFVEEIPLSEANALREEGFALYERLGSVQGVFLDTLQDSPVADRNVRLALNYGTDKETYNEALLYGFGYPVGQLGNHVAFGWNPDIEPYPYDLELALQHLQDSPFPDGFTESMHYMPPHGEIGADVALYLQQSWARDLSVQVELDPIEQAVYFEYSARGGFHPMVLGAQGFGSDVTGALRRWAFEGQPPARHRYNNPEFDRLFHEAQEQFDADERRRLLQEAQQVLHDDAALVFLRASASVHAHIGEISGFHDDPDGHVVWTSGARSR